ncbi:hypothetical protein Dimus_018718 [Dionaea muscipula]
MHVDACKEFYARLTMIHYKKKEVARSSVRGVEIEFDNERLASILGIPGNNGICEYIKEVWEESKYTKPLEITRKFVNDETLTTARRVKSSEMKQFQRFVHFLVMKNVVPRFGKRDTTSYMDLIYMDHIASRRLVNLPRVMMRRMSYVISVKDHELPYGSGENRRRDDEEVAPAENEEVHGEEEVHDDFEWEAVVDEAALQGESGSGEKFYDAEDKIQEPAAVVEEVQAVATQDLGQQKEIKAAGVNPSGPSGHIPDSLMIQLQADFERARANRIQADLERAQAENARLLALLKQAQSQPKP